MLASDVPAGPAQVYGETKPKAANVTVREEPPPPSAPPLEAAKSVTWQRQAEDVHTLESSPPQATAGGGWRALLFGPKAAPPEAEDSLALRPDDAGGDKAEGRDEGAEEAEKAQKGSLGAKMRAFWAKVDRALDDGSNKPLPGTPDDGTSNWSPMVGKARAA